LAGDEPELACHHAPWRGGTPRRGQLCSNDGRASGVAHDHERGDVVLVRVTVSQTMARGGVATATAAAALCRSRGRRSARRLTPGLRRLLARTRGGSERGQAGATVNQTEVAPVCLISPAGRGGIGQAAAALLRRERGWSELAIRKCKARTRTAFRPG
jgi:hypothetical protein